jgi:hypothetical protein
MNTLLYGGAIAAIVVLGISIYEKIWPFIQN